MNRPVSVRRVLRAMASDQRVDWVAALDANTPSESSRSVLEALQHVDRISEAFRTHGSASATAGGAVLPRPDTHLERWGTMRLLDELGRGSHGVVYRAFDERLHREVALKFMHSGLPAGLAGVLVEEARLLARVTHPNVVTVYGAEMHAGRYGIWMELIGGCTLHDVVLRQGPIGPSEAALIAVEVCRGLSAIHGAGVLYRDLKAHNVMRAQGGRIVLMDFSSSRATEQHGEVAGTPLYLAPEVLAGEPASERSDLYSAGVLLYHLVTGSYPVGGADLEDVRRAHRDRAARPLRDLRPDLPAPFVEVVNRTLAADPAARPRSAGDLEADLLATLRSPEPVAASGWRMPVVAAAALAAVLVASVAAMNWGRGSAADATGSAVSSQPWLLIGAFENTTSETELGLSIEHALERELTQSRQIRVTPRARVDDTLRLMKRPLDTVLDRRTAREVALRDGGLRTFVIGRVEPAGAGFVLRASVVDVATGELRASVSSDAADVRQLQTATRHLSDQIRTAVGDATVHTDGSADDLERVTTPSLDALRIYSESYRLGARNDWEAALHLAKLAVDQDPAFPAARIWLAWCLYRANAPPSVYQAVAAQALAMSGNATEWERLWIIGSYHDMTSDVQRAIGAYEALLRLQPDHYWASGNIAIAYGRQGRFGEAIPIALRLTTIRPHDHRTLNIAFSALRRAGRYGEASDIAARMRTVHEEEQRYWLPDAWLFDAYVAWAAADAPATLVEVHRVVSVVTGLAEGAKTSILPEAAHLYLALGRPSDARRILSLVPDVARRNLHLAMVALHEGERARAGELMRAAHYAAADARDLWERVWVLARAGAIEDAGRLTNMVRQPTALGSMMVEASRARDGWLDAAEGEIALAAGDPETAITLLQRSLPALTADVTVTPAQLYRAAETLADALDATNRGREAVPHLQAVLERQERATFAGAPLWALRCALRLALLADRAGAPAVADALLSDLRARLAQAEAGFPVPAAIR